MPKIKLASQRLSSGGSGGGLSASKLPTGAGQVSASGAKISAPSINPNAANTRFTPYKVPEIQDDILATTLMAGATVAETMNQSAFKFQERQDQVDADALVLQYRSDMRKANIDYQQQELRDATDGYDRHVARIEDSFNSLAESASSGVLKKAALRMGEARNIALSNGATHKVQQFRLLEQQNEYALTKDQEAAILAAKDGFSHFDTESSKGFLANQKTQKLRDGHVKTQMTLAIRDDYEKQIRAGTDPLVAIQSTEQKYLKYKGMLDPLSAQELDEWMMTKTVAAEKAAVVARNKAQANYREQIKYQAGKDFYQWGTNDEVDRITQSVPFIRSQFEYESQGEDAVVKAHKDMFDEVDARSQNMDTTDFRMLLDARMNDLFRGERDQVYTELEKTAIMDYALRELPNKRNERQNTKDSLALVGLSKELDKARKEGKPFGMVPPPPGMSVPMTSKWNELQANQEKERRDGIPLSLRQNRAGTAAHYNNKLLLGPLSKKDEARIQQLMFDGHMDLGVWTDLTTKNINMTRGGNSEQERFKSDPNYTATNRMIDNAVSIGMYVGGDKKPKKGQELLDWEYQNDLATTQAKADLVRAIRRQGMDSPGSNFDYNQWWTDYVRANYGSGGATTNSLWSNMGGFLTTPPWEYAEPIEAAKDAWSGDASVMDPETPPRSRVIPGGFPGAGDYTEPVEPGGINQFQRVE